MARATVRRPDLVAELGEEVRAAARKEARGWRQGDSVAWSSKSA